MSGRVEAILLRWLVVGKLFEGAADGGGAGHITGTVPAAEWPPQRAGRERVQGRARGGELIGALGEAGVRQPDARTGRSPVAAPFVSAGEAPQLGERNDFAELLIQSRARSQFGFQRGKQLALQRVEDRCQVSPERQTLRSPSGSNKSQ